jgi:hypothetical protein
MSGNTSFTNASIILAELFNTGSYMNERDLEFHLVALQNNARAMVETRRERVAAPPMRRAPQQVEIRMPPPPRPQAQLRPAAGPLREQYRSGQLREQLHEEPIRELFWEQHIVEKTMSRANFNALCEDSCAICLDTHKKGDSITSARCKHEFGKECLKNWFSNENSHKKCPICRAKCGTLYSYKTRAPRRPHAVEVAVIEN